jgi:glutaminyl-tRNA synthetase
VYDQKVSGWDDPRMPTIVGLRRRGYTPESLQLFAERIGVTKSDSWIDYSTLEGCLREDLENKAHRGMAVLDPVKLVLTNWGEVFGSDAYLEDCIQPAGAPQRAEADGQEPPERVFKIGREVWIERTDYRGDAAQGLLPPLSPNGNDCRQRAPEVRPRHRMHRRRHGCQKARSPKCTPG